LSDPIPHAKGDHRAIKNYALPNTGMREVEQMRYKREEGGGGEMGESEEDEVNKVGIKR
jgi:hypothetical protein